MKRLAIVGSTGSIGKQTLEVIKKMRDHKVVALSCGHNFSLFKDQLLDYKPEYAAAIRDTGELKRDFPEITFFSGVEGIKEMLEAANPDVVVNSASGAVGLRYSLKALEVSKRLCLANKESLVCGGKLLVKRAAEKGVEIIPVDSEHSGIFQLMHGEEERPEKIFITASGGALRDYPLVKIENALLEEVLKHPTWSMGNRITIDSATMVNKGLEVIEAHYLFDYEEKNILTYICRNSFIHGGVIYKDGVIKMHLGKPDMKIPIAYALSYPARKYQADYMDITEMSLSLEKVDYKRYPALELAREIVGIPSKQIAYNAADEIAVKYFERGAINFGGIFKLIKRVVELIPEGEPRDFDEIIEIDRYSRELAKKEVAKLW
ncbi:1-deoxy-D-xylulose 5-phosphate reductoisomerase [Kosmotoga arenicorallina S304]|uniref:1-deoxy-D-xylulose 5-phosphate reductoisomerase n=1 Tax=Kosmotoga arenicorallina S304 TaxID=1453497 RepID=A0A176K1H0_9BACT|nr:1-deoxy-D-xylulose-5-phosphate reductoisomerase [Kosmotoga arenicorallina]OAA30976.1 1-deoxy-D-xylulose 5-phosphate reductoisomerase [Kosmotoga arenicorallina S304]